MASEKMGRSGLTFDQLAVGDRFVSARRTVTETDVVFFSGLSGDFNPLHTDAEFATSTPFGKRVAHGMLVASIGTGLGNQLGIFEGTTLALLEQVLRYKAPVFFGDTIHVEISVQEKKKTSKPDRGVVTVDVPIVNQDGKTVVEQQWTLLLKRET